MSNPEESELGHTIIADNHEPSNFDCYAVLTVDADENKELQEPGVVYEIIEPDTDNKCFGIVDESTRMSDRDVISEELSQQGSQDREPLTSTVLKLQTFRESGLSTPVGRNAVERAGSEGIRTAYDIPAGGIPIGLYTLPSGLPEETTPVRLPPEYVVGPEAAHINIGGKTGYAKTSMGLVTCKSILTEPGLENETTVIAFNVKADDLLWVDKENEEIEDIDREIYDRMGINPKPFGSVEVLAPEKPNAPNQPNSERIDATPFSYVWEDVSSQVNLIVSQGDMDAKLRGVFNDLNRMMGADNIIKFNDAITDLDRLIQNNQGDAWIDFPGAGQHNQYTVIKARRVLEGTLAELEGLLDGRANEPDIENLIAPGQFNVIDISELPSTGQRLVVSKIRRDVTQLLERNRAGVENAIFFADELNKFAPRNPRGQLARLKEELDDTAERGRAVGATLLGVEQYPSEISSAIIGNVATKAYSRLGRQEMEKVSLSRSNRSKKDDNHPPAVGLHDGESRPLSGASSD